MSAWVRRHIGIPFEEVGRCWGGLVCRVYEAELGVEVPRYQGAINAAEKAEIEALFRQEFAAGSWIEIPLGQEREFDVVWLRMPQGRTATHAGVVVRPGLMLHADEGRVGVTCTDRYDEGAWSRLLIGFRRHVKMADRHAA